MIYIFFMDWLNLSQIHPPALPILDWLYPFSLSQNPIPFFLQEFYMGALDKFLGNPPAPLYNKYFSV